MPPPLATAHRSRLSTGGTRRAWSAHGRANAAENHFAHAAMICEAGRAAQGGADTDPEGAGMTSGAMATRVHLRPTGTRLLGVGRGPLPAPGHALLGGAASRAGEARLRPVHAVLRDADRHSRLPLPRRLRLQGDLPGAGERGPGTLPAGGGGLRAQALAGAVTRMGRHVQTRRDPDTSGASGDRSRCAVSRGPGRLPDAVPRPPRRDDLPAHAL